jgi:hypothetical protein
VYGTWKKSQLDDEDLRQEIFTHLQGIGKYIAAIDIVQYMAHPNVQKHHGMKRGIYKRTARNLLNRLGYHWTLKPSGQYVDGHEHEDIVRYRQNVFLPWWKELEPQLRVWSQDGKKEVIAGEGQ